MISKLIKYQRYSGIIGILVLWICIPISMKRTGLGIIDSRPLSYLGVDPRSAVLFSAGLLLSALLFVNFAFYVKRTYRTSNRFLYYFLIGQLGQVVAAISPYGDNSKYKTIHTIAAFVLAFSLPLLIRQFTVSQSNSMYRKQFLALLRIEQTMFIIGIGLFVFTEGIAPLGEALPAIGFHIWIFAATYLVPKNANS